MPEREHPDEPTFSSPEWQRRKAVGTLEMEQVGQVGVAHERRPEAPQQPQQPMRWTATPPDAEGFWWNRHRDRPTSAVPVYVFRMGVSFYMLDPGGKHQVDVRGRWQDLWGSGPIPEPEGDA